jgi:uncharacterized delta-60 repeat protein
LAIGFGRKSPTINPTIEKSNKFVVLNTLTMKNKILLPIIFCFLIYSLSAFAQNQAGAYDTTFSHDGKIRIADFSQITSYTSEIFALQIQSDGKIVTGGHEDNVFSLARYLPNGNLDSSFGNNGFVLSALTDSLGNISGTIYSLILQDDGKILVAGRATRPQYSTFALARYLNNGDPDVSFGLNGQLVLPVIHGFTFPKSIKVQSDGKIVVAGYAKVDSTLDYGVLRFLENGSLDTSFHSTGKFILDFEGADDYLTDMLVLPNNKILLGGIVERTINQVYTQCMGLVQLNANGGLDTLFGTNGLNKNVPFKSYGSSKLGINSQGKILFNGGNFGFFQMLQYNANGSLDSTFGNNGLVSCNPDYSLYDEVPNVLIIQPDDKILVGGSSLQLIGTNSRYLTILRFNPDGSLDNSFDYDGKILLMPYHSGVNDLYAMGLQNDGKIIAAGKLRVQSGFYCQGICRLLGECQPGNFNNNISLCDGEILQVGTSTYDSAGVYVDVLQGFSGCDSLVNTHLQYLPNIDFEQDLYMVPGDSILIGNNYYSNYGTYIDTLSSSIGCDSVITSHIFLITGSKAYSGSKTIIEARPNPFSQQIIIRGLEKDGMLMIFDTQGKKLLQFNTNAESLNLDLSFLSPGIYFVQFIGSNRNESMRLVKDYD